jgi:hypothetical protein
MANAKDLLLEEIKVQGEFVRKCKSEKLPKAKVN